MTTLNIWSESELLTITLSLPLEAFVNVEIVCAAGFEYACGSIHVLEIVDSSLSNHNLIWPTCKLIKLH